MSIPHYCPVISILLIIKIANESRPDRQAAPVQGDTTTYSTQKLKKKKKRVGDDRRIDQSRIEQKKNPEERRHIVSYRIVFQCSFSRGFLFDMPISFALGFFGIRRASHPPKNSAAKKEKNYYNKNNSKPEFPDPVCLPAYQPTNETTDQQQPSKQTTNCDSFLHVKFACCRCFFIFVFFLYKVRPATRLDCLCKALGLSRDEIFKKKKKKKDNWQSGLPFAIVSLSFAVVGLN